MKSCSAAAPCSTANLGPGYDVFGLALDALEDKVKVSRTYPDGGRITIKNSDQAIPSMPESNSAGLVVKKMMQDFEISDSTEIEITKGVPSGYGVGSSAASATAAAMAFNALYDLKIDRNRLIEYAAEGEVASAGTKHYDNVSASLLGGFVICRIASDRLQFTRLEPPKDLVLVVAVPCLEVPNKKAKMVAAAMAKGFKETGVESRTFVCRASKGARLLA